MLFDPYNIDRARELSDANDPRNPENWTNELDVTQPVDIKVFEVPGRDKLVVLIFNSDEDWEWYTTEASLEDALDWSGDAEMGELKIEDFEGNKDIGSWKEIKNEKRLIADTSQSHNNTVDPVTDIGKAFVAQYFEY